MSTPVSGRMGCSWSGRGHLPTPGVGGGVISTQRSWTKRGDGDVMQGKLGAIGTAGNRCGGRQLMSTLASSTKFGPKFLSVSKAEIWGQVVLCPGVCPVHR